MRHVEADARFAVTAAPRAKFGPRCGASGSQKPMPEREYSDSVMSDPAGGISDTALQNRYLQARWSVKQ